MWNEKEKTEHAGERKRTWQSDQRNGSCITEMQFQYWYVGLPRLSVGGGDHRESRPSKKKLYAMGITERPRMQHVRSLCIGASQNTRERSDEIERDIIERFCHEEYGEETREKSSDIYVAIATQLRTYIELTVSPACIKNWRMTYISLQVRTFCRIKMQKNWILVLRDKDIRE